MMGEGMPAMSGLLFRSLTGLAIIASLSSCGASRSTVDKGGTWQSQIEKIRVAVRGDEADPERVATWTGYKAHLTAITGLETQTFEASDYNGIIQAVSSGQVDMATMGGGSYANVDAQVGNRAVPILTVRQAEGTIGYYSALMVRADSPYKTVEDLRGKSIAYVDFNSTSGYIYPRMALVKEGFDPDKFFGKSILAGGATQAALALMNGQVDAAMISVSGGTPETGFTTGGPYTLARRGMIKLEDTRLIWTAGPIPNSPFVIRTDRPKPFVDVIRGALAVLPYEKPEVWAEMSQTAGSTFAPVNRNTYADIIAIRNDDIKTRRKGEGARK
jgi:phosphonate transport system substrate-binding protein